MTDPVTPLHYAPNANIVNGQYAPGADGFNLADISSASELSELPSGVKALVWLGMTGGATATFQSAVTSFAGSSQVYGFYLADEPAASPTTAANLKAESDWIHTHFPGAKTFIVEDNFGSDASPSFYYTPANTDVDLFGIDPYPVKNDNLDASGNPDYSIIPTAVSSAVAQGIPKADQVPVYQAFGNWSPWITPTAAQEQEILSTWGSVLPAPAFDYAYSWGAQSGDTAISTDPALQAVFATHNAGGAASAPAAPTIGDGAVRNGYVNAANDTSSQALSGTGAAGSTINVYLNGATTPAYTTHAAATTGAWSITVGALAPGSYSYTATATDSAGTSVPSSALSFTVDTTAPAAPTIGDSAVQSGGVSAANDTSSQALSGTSGANSTVNIFLNGSTTPAYTTLADASGHWSQTIGQLASGSYSYTATATDAAGNTSAPSSPLSFTVSAPASPPPDPPTVPRYDHIVLVVEENHDYSQIIGSSQAPYINNTLVAGGTLLTNYDAITHPSEANYFSLYAGSTFNISPDDPLVSEPDPTIYTTLHGAGLTFQGYVDTAGGSSYDHNPWTSFPEGQGSTPSVGTDFANFPANGNYSSLPTVSYVTPGVNDDMHDGTIQQGDAWLQNNLGAYAAWATTHNSLLIVTWDENDGTSDGNHVATILYGAHVQAGATNGTAYNHYDLLSTILASYGLTGPNNAATAAPINVFSSGGAGGSLAATERLTGATEGVAIGSSTTIASFTDTNSADLASGFTATIAWGDGTSTAGAISGGSGNFTVSGGHTYADEGSEPLSVTITRTADKASVAATGTVAVADADKLTAHAATIVGTAGQALSNVAVASFTDSDTASPASDFVATIKWGDGSSSAGTVSGGAGAFSVTGSHTYASAGSEAVAVTLTDDGGGASATANSTATIGGGAGGSLAATERLTGATEGVAIGSSTTIASFTDTNSADLASGFTATIAWGDGTSTAGAISGGSGNFTVSGGHTYADEGSEALSVTITRTADKASVAAKGTVAVADADKLTAHAATIAGTAGQALNNVAVASFTDSDTASPASDFVATIKWGDGSSSAGTVSGGAGAFSVTGSHTYASAGSDAVAVTLTDDGGGASATANSTATIGGGAGGGGGTTISTAVTGPLDVAASDNPLTIASTGVVTSTASSADGIDGLYNAPTTVTNLGRVDATGGGWGAGIWLPDGGTVTVGAGAETSAPYGVEVSGGSGTVINSGTISGSQEAVLFDNSANDRLVVNPTAVFHGDVVGGSGSNTLELAGGTGSITGLSGGSGTISQNGTWSFSGFGVIDVDSGGVWTIAGGNVPHLANDGVVVVAGALDVSSAIDSSSTGLFRLDGGATLDVAAATGSGAKMAFLGGDSSLALDDYASFGSLVGSSSYTGPLLEDFAAGDKVDLKTFHAAGAMLLYDSSSGILQLSNSESQHASLLFQNATLGAGAFSAVSDGGSGLLITHK